MTLKTAAFFILSGFCLAAGAVPFLSLPRLSVQSALSSPARMPSVKRYIPFFLMAFSAALITGGVVRYTLAAGSFYSGIPAEAVVRLEGVCAGDGTAVSADNAAVTIRLERVAARNGASASASGHITAFISTGDPLYRGERLILDGAFVPAGDTDSRGPLFVSSPAIGGRKGIDGPLLSARRTALTAIRKKIAASGAQSAPLFQALFLGVKDDLGTLDAELFRRAGCSHILALSGMHLGIISGLLFLLLRPFAGSRGSFFGVTVIIALYIGLTGFRSALVRAGLMFFLFGLAKISGRRADIRSVFLTVFLLLSVLTPRALSSLSFQLSFLALAGILFIAPSVHSIWKPYVPAAVSLPVSASLAAQTATAPLIAAAFGTIYPAGIIGSMLITPLITLFMSGGMLALAVPFSPVTEYLFSAMDYLYRGILFLLDTASLVPSISFQSPFMLRLLWAGAVLCLLVPAARSLRYRRQYRTMLINGTY